MSENLIFEEKETNNINKNDIDFNENQNNEDLELENLFKKLEKEDKLSKIFDKLQYFQTNENTSVNKII